MSSKMHLVLCINLVFSIATFDFIIGIIVSLDVKLKSCRSFFKLQGFITHMTKLPLKAIAKFFILIAFFELKSFFEYLLFYRFSIWIKMNFIHMIQITLFSGPTQPCKDNE
uniref:Uncharacterized protein n=1 Tax=Cacopsylla melanoneura TaxID=428564 RepID=A0A8D8ZIL5_9HEMI